MLNEKSASTRFLVASTAPRSVERSKAIVMRSSSEKK